MSWLDASIGWTREFNTIVTYMPDDPAIDAEKSDFKEYMSDNLSSEHLVIIDGKTPEEFHITIPTAAQWSSIVPYMRNADRDLEVSTALACHALFEMCVDIPGNENIVREHRNGFRRLPEKFMDWVIRNHPFWIEMVGGFLMQKYQLTDEEKKR